MMRCYDKHQKTKEVTLCFKREELLYDIGNYSFVEGDILEADSEHSRHQVFDVVQSGNVDRVTRILNLAHSECVEMLYPYTKTEIPQDQEPLDDELIAPDVYTITLSLPEGFSQTTVNLVKHMIHEYLVCRVLADWFSITNPKSQPNWEDKTAKLRQRMQTALMSRRGIVKRKLKPF